MAFSITPREFNWYPFRAENGALLPHPLHKYVRRILLTRRVRGTRIMVSIPSLFAIYSFLTVVAGLGRGVFLR